MNKALNISIAAIIGCILVSGFLYAAPVDIPTSIQESGGNVVRNKEQGVGLSITGEADFLYTRKLDLSNNGGIIKVKGRFYTAKAILTIIDKLDIYGIFGKAKNLEDKSDSIKIKPKDKLTWGAGLSMPIYKWKNWGIELFADAKYRAVNNIDYNSNRSGLGGIGGNTRPLPKYLVDWQEWQAAFGITKRFRHYLPYLGLKYSDFKESHDSSSAKSDKVIGIFIGCNVVPIEAFSIGLQGRFIDETAFTVKASYKF